MTNYENLHELVSRVNLWIEQHHIDVLTVETVLVTSLPNETEASPKAEPALLRQPAYIHSWDNELRGLTATRDGGINSAILAYRDERRLGAILALGTFGRVLREASFHLAVEHHCSTAFLYPKDCMGTLSFTT
jgi:hypothetical protein